MPASTSLFSATTGSKKTSSSRSHTTKEQRATYALRVIQKRSSDAAPRTPLAVTYDASVNIDPKVASTSKLMLPAKLMRPTTGHCDIEENLAIHYPELSGVPLEYIQDSISRSACCEAIKAAKVAPFNSKALPKALTISVNDEVAAACPTHMLAVHGGIPSSHRASALSSKKLAEKAPSCAVGIYPIHHLLFASHCARFPTAIPLSQPLDSVDDQGDTSVPVAALRVPSPETFSLLHGYLYTRSAARIAVLLSPPCGADWLQLAQHAKQVHGLWANAYSLGVVDEQLYNALDLAWARTLGAMRACQ
ncbi:unnamed protein product [Mycena citricolor]|uniref:Uncharacterized protein n=1 Tax=Mycena citricolor TaxID=2018698 RepID=A0AAD2HNJ1_9AGAR|nr:unnamed protein product [Mycena citricolor]